MLLSCVSIPVMVLWCEMLQSGLLLGVEAHDLTPYIMDLSSFLLGTWLCPV